MRDMERLREKIEVSLDDRQVAALAVCALLLLGGVFSLGLLVGKRLAAAAPAASTVNDLAALDEQAAQPAAPKLPPPAAAKPVPGNAAAPPAQKPAPAPAKPPLPDDLDEQPMPDQLKTQGQAVPQPAQAALAAAPRMPAVVDPPQKPRSFEAVQKHVVLAAPPRNLGRFTVQFGASQDHGEAQRLEARARLAGLKPYIVEARLGSKGTWYRVRVGAFSDKDAASEYRRDVERELRVTAMVMPTH